MARIGVYVCRCGRNISSTVDVDRVAQEAARLPGVVEAMANDYTCSDPGQNQIIQGIKNHALDRVVVASCSPHIQQPTFMRALVRAGLNPYMFEMANLREHCAWVHHDRQEATEKAIDLVSMAVAKVRHDAPLAAINIPMTKRALVIGGGIAGIQAALDIAAAGQEVVVVEREPSIGGHMAQLGETFPTLDCSQCILTPKMVEAGQSSKITLHTYAEIESISGFVGNFRARIRKKATYVDWSSCNGCGECERVCPIRVPSRFQMGLAERTAIYRMFPQAVPSRFTIDKRGVSPCRAACPAGTSAQGYVALIAEGRYSDALRVIKEYNPFPATVGRVCTHPCETACNRGKVDKPVAICALKRFVADAVYTQEDAGDAPADEERIWTTADAQRVAIVGAGPAGLTAAHLLARRGYRVTVFEALPVAGGMMRVGIPSYRLPRDVLQHEIDHIVGLGVDLRLNTPVRDVNALLDGGYAAVFLGIGAHEPLRLRIPGEDVQGVYQGIDFLRRVNLGEQVPVGRRVVVVGGGNTAMDAARSAVRLGAHVTIAYRRSRDEMPANDWDVAEAESEGIALEMLTQPVRVISKDGHITGIECVRMTLGEPDASGRRRPLVVEGSQFIMEADTLIAAVAQAPQLSLLGTSHGIEVTAQGAFAVDPATLATSRPGIFAGGDASRGPGALIEAIADGRRAALSIDRYLRGEPLTAPEAVDQLPVVELEAQEAKSLLRSEHVSSEARKRVPEAPVGERIRDFREVQLGLSEEQARAEALRCLRCGVCSECGECERTCPPGAIRHRMTDEIIEVDVGAIVMATGYQLAPKAQAREYGYGRYPDVIDGLEFERLLSASGPTGGEIRRPSDGRAPKSVVFIQCVGSRDPEHGVSYCSKICCMYSAKHAILYKHRVHEGQAYVFYMDNRTAGKNYDEFARRAIEEEGALYLRGRVSRVFQKGGRLIVRGADTLAGVPVEIEADLVVLAMALTPQTDAAQVANKVGISYDLHGFFNEAHPKLRPIETNTAGVFLAGTCQAPRDIPETVAQATAAAGKVLQLFSGDQYIREPLIAKVDQQNCNACFFCREICPYDAIEEGQISVRVNGSRKDKVVASANEGKCMGCGVCVAACPSKAIMVRGFSDQQVYEEVMHAI